MGLEADPFPLCSQTPNLELVKIGSKHILNFTYSLFLQVRVRDCASELSASEPLFSLVIGGYQNSFAAIVEMSLDGYFFFFSV